MIMIIIIISHETMPTNTLNETSWIWSEDNTRVLCTCQR